MNNETTTTLAGDWFIWIPVAFRLLVESLPLIIFLAGVVAFFLLIGCYRTLRRLERLQAESTNKLLAGLMR